MARFYLTLPQGSSISIISNCEKKTSEIEIFTFFIKQYQVVVFLRSILLLLTISPKKPSFRRSKSFISAVCHQTGRVRVSKNLWRLRICFKSPGKDNYLVPHAIVQFLVLHVNTVIRLFLRFGHGYGCHGDLAGRKGPNSWVLEKKVTGAGLMTQTYLDLRVSRLYRSGVIIKNKQKNIFVWTPAGKKLCRIQYVNERRWPATKILIVIYNFIWLDFYIFLLCWHSRRRESNW
jgi:hypothetical protein